MAAFVADASVVTKWVVQEEASDETAGLIDGLALRTPDVLMPERANIPWKVDWTGGQALVGRVMEFDEIESRIG